MAKKLYEESNIQAIADAIRTKNGTTTTYTTAEMAAAITAITTGGGDGGFTIPESAFTLTGDCSYTFSGGTWDWFIDNYGDRITTNNITYAFDMFNKTRVKEVPFVSRC